MTQSSPQPTQQFRGKLTRRTLLLLLPLTIIPIALIGIVNLSNSATFLREQIFLQFNNVTQAQVEEIDSLVAESQAFFTQLETDTSFSRALDPILAASPQSAQWWAMRSALMADYTRILNTQTVRIFDDIAIVTPENKIIVSTNLLLEGNELDPEIFETFLSTQTSFLYYDTYQFTNQTTNRLVLLTSHPFYDDAGQRKATLIGFSRPEAFERILQIGQLSHPQARSYYIANSDLGDVFVGLSPTTGEITAFSPSMDHIETVLPKVKAQENASLVEFESFNDTPVLGFVNWLDSIKATIVLEVPETAITVPIQDAMQAQVVLLGIVILIIGVIIWQGTRRIVRPIEAVSATARQFADGDREVRAVIDRDDEIGLLANSFNYVADQLVALYRSMESAIEARTQQVQTTAEVAQIVTSATNLDEMLERAAHLITTHFGYYQTSIYLMDRSGDNLVLRETTGQATETQYNRRRHIAVGSRSIVGNVAASNTPWVADDIKQDPYYIELERLPATQSEAAIPLSIGGRVLGVLDVQSDALKAFDAQDVATLQTLGRQLASAIQNARLLENTRDDLQAANLLYQTSSKLAEAETTPTVLQNLCEILQQTPYLTQVFALEAGKLQSVADAAETGSRVNLEGGLPLAEAARQQILTKWANQAIPVDYPPEGFSQKLLELAQQMGCREFVLLPLTARERLLGLIILGVADENTLRTVNLELYHSMAQMTNATLEKIEAGSKIAENLTELQSLSALSQAISTEANLADLFGILHQQVIQTVGDDVSFLIALYDADTALIEIPYMTENDQIISIPTFPLGQGLTSIVIRTRQSLMIVEDTVNRSQALGAIVTSGKAAKSWLGVPLIAAGEVVGAMAVQDLENEYRFDDDDLRLFSTLAGQVAPTIRNARLLAVTQADAERDRQLYEITSNIRRATSIPEILEITTRELSHTLNLKKATIEISTELAAEKGPDNEPEEPSE